MDKATAFKMIFLPLEITFFLHKFVASVRPFFFKKKKSENACAFDLPIIWGNPTYLSYSRVLSPL